MTAVSPHPAADAPLTAILDRVAVVVGPRARDLHRVAEALAARAGGDALAAETGCIRAAADQMAAMAAAPPGMDEAGGDLDALCARLRHDLRGPLVAVKGYGELVLEIAEADGLDAVADDARHVLDAASEVLVAIEQALPARSRALMAEMAAADGGEAAPAGPVGRILVADDSDRNREVLVQYLAREGHEVVAVADGLTALEAVQDQRFDLALLDMIMPGLNGDEVLKGIKADPALHALPVIMISALDETDSIVRCIEAGAEDYLPKPFNRVLLRARIGACLEKRRLREVELDYLAAVEKELTIAREVQASILPRRFPPHPAAAGSGLMTPARDVGGDFYDYFLIDDDRIGVAVGDVSGKGVPAAVYMAMVRTLLRATALFGLSPAKCLQRLNDQLSADNDSGMFVSLFYGILDCATGAFTYANGGHNWPAVIRADGGVEWVRGTDDLLVGVIYGSAYHDASLTLAPGDSLLLYTDGVVEAADPAEEEFGRRRLAEVLAAHAGAEPEDMLAAVLAAVRRFEAGQPPSDDLTCVALRFRGGPTDSNRFEMGLTPDLVEIARLIPALDAYFNRMEVPAAAAYPLTMAIEEAVATVVRHGHGARSLTIRIERTGDGLAAEVEDDGQPLAPADEDGDLGVGMQFVMTLVDRASYDRDGEFNRLRLLKALA